MSRKRASSKKSSHKPDFVEVQSKKLHALCRNLAHRPEDLAADVWGDQARDLTQRYLAAAQDQVFFRALELAADDEAAIDELLFTIEYEAQTRFVKLANGEVGTLNLFAIPVQVISTGGMPTRKVHLPPKPAFGDLVRSFKKHGLIRQDATVALADYLYHHSELDLPFSKVWRLTERVYVSALGTPVAPEALAQAGRELPAKTGAEGAMLVELFYLVGAWVDAVDAPLPFGGGTADAEEDEAYAQTVEAWQVATQPLLLDLLPKKLKDPSVHLGWPDDFFDACRDGMVGHEDLGLTLKTRQILEQAQVAPKGTRALVAYYVAEDGSRDDIGVSLLSRLTGEFLGGVSRAILPHETMEDVAEAIVYFLESLDIGEVAVADDPQPLLTCDCCGEQTFLSPQPDESVEDESLPDTKPHAHTASRHLH